MVKNPNIRKNSYEEEYEEEKVLKNKQQNYEDALWQCERLDPRKEQLKGIPQGEQQQENWIKTRKVDNHLDLDFLPRSLVYNYGDFAESNEMMEQVLEQIHEIEAINTHLDDYSSDAYKSSKFKGADVQRKQTGLRDSNISKASNFSRNIFSKQRTNEEKNFIRNS